MKSTSHVQFFDKTSEAVRKNPSILPNKTNSVDTTLVWGSGGNIIEVL